MLTNLGNFIQMLLILTANFNIFFFIRNTCKNIRKQETTVIIFSIS